MDGKIDLLDGKSNHLPDFLAVSSPISRTFPLHLLILSLKTSLSWWSKAPI